MLLRLDSNKHPRLIFLVLVLFAVVGPLSIDLFTPSLPAITSAFSTTSDMSQWTVSIFMLGFAISMLIVGPVSERLGNRRALLAGYTIYLLATVAILLTESIHVFIAARLIQAVFGCFGTALSRVIARDLYKGKNDIRILGMISATLVVAPMIAPAIGGHLQQVWGWESSFVLMLVMAVIAMGAVILLPGEDEPDPNAGFSETLTSFSTLFRDRRYMVLALTASLAFAGAFVFVAGAPFVLIGSFHISPRNYGMIFGVIMGSYIISSLLAGRVTDKLGRQKANSLAWSILVVGAAIAFGSAFVTEGQSVAGLVAGLAIYEIGLGIFLPSCQSRALAHLDKHAGTGAGLIFFLEMIVASGVSFAAGKMPLDNTLPLAGITLAMVLLALVLARFGRGAAEPLPASA